MTEFPPESAAAHGIAVCHTCCGLSPASAHKCSRCGAPVHLRQTDSLHRTIALVITASILYIPANVLPIMTTDQLGQAIDSPHSQRSNSRKSQFRARPRRPATYGTPGLHASRPSKNSELRGLLGKSELASGDAKP